MNLVIRSGSRLFSLDRIISNISPCSFSITTKTRSGVSNIHSRFTIPGWCKFWRVAGYVYDQHKQKNSFTMQTSNNVLQLSGIHGIERKTKISCKSKRIGSWIGFSKICSAMDALRGKEVFPVNYISALVHYYYIFLIFLVF